MTNWLPILLAILAGVLTPTQGAINNKLTQFVGNPICPPSSHLL
ncbi:MAG: DMT family transporter [Saprospiraceae bacterium]|nr:DMT family transporter [Candidatus Brachybacter algidus]